MTTNTNGRRDNLDAAQDAIAFAINAHPDLQTSAITRAYHEAHCRALIDIARTLRSLEGYLCKAFSAGR